MGADSHPPAPFRNVTKISSGSYPQGRYHPAKSVSATGMPAQETAPAAALQLRLSEQLQALSLVSETLTLRLLELEERLTGLEGKLEGLELSQNEGSSCESSDMLAATEERIARLEELLDEQSPVAHSASVHPLRPAVAETSSAANRFSEPELALNPFPEEEEQPFMDELSA
jgi:TolA-binding protein